MKARLAATKARASVGTIYDWRCTDCSGASTSAAGSRATTSKRAGAADDIIDLTLDSDDEDSKPVPSSTGLGGARVNATANTAGTSGQPGSPTVSAGRSVKTPLSPPPSRSPSVVAVMPNDLVAAVKPDSPSTSHRPAKNDSSAVAPHLPGGLAEPHRPSLPKLKHHPSAPDSRPSISRSLMSHEPSWEPPSVDSAKLASVPTIDFSNASSKRRRPLGRYNSATTGDPEEEDVEETNERPAKRRRTTIAGIPHTMDNVAADMGTAAASTAGTVLDEQVEVVRSSLSTTTVATAFARDPVRKAPVASTSISGPANAEQAPPRRHARSPGVTNGLIHDDREGEANRQQRGPPPQTITTPALASPAPQPRNTIRMRVTPQPMRSLVPVDPAQRAYLQQQRAQQSPQRGSTSPTIERSTKGKPMPHPPVASTSEILEAPRSAIPRKRTRSISPTPFAAARTSKRPAPEMFPLPGRSNSASAVSASLSTSLATRPQHSNFASSSTSLVPSLVIPPPSSTAAPPRRYSTSSAAIMLENNGERDKGEHEFEHPAGAQPSASSFFGSASQRARKSVVPPTSATPYQFVVPPASHSASARLDVTSDKTSAAGLPAIRSTAEARREEGASGLPSAGHAQISASSATVLPPSLSPTSSASRRVNPFANNFSQPQPQPQPSRPPTNFRRDVSMPPIAFLAEDDLLSSPELVRAVPARALPVPTSKKAKPKEATQGKGKQKESEKIAIAGTQTKQLDKTQSLPQQTAVARKSVLQPSLPLPPLVARLSTGPTVTSAPAQPLTSVPVRVSSTASTKTTSTSTATFTTASPIETTSENGTPTLGTIGRQASITSTSVSRAPAPIAASQTAHRAASLNQSSTAKANTIRVPRLMGERKASVDSTQDAVEQTVGPAAHKTPAAAGESNTQPRLQQLNGPAKLVARVPASPSPDSAQSTQVVESSVAEERELDFELLADERNAPANQQPVESLGTTLVPRAAAGVSPAVGLPRLVDNSVTKLRETTLLLAQPRQEPPRQESAVTPTPTTTSSSMPRQVMRKRVHVPKLRRPVTSTTASPATASPAPEVQAAAGPLLLESNLKLQPASVPRVVALKDVELVREPQTASSSRVQIEDLNEPVQHADADSESPQLSEDHIGDPASSIAPGSANGQSLRDPGSAPPSGPPAFTRQTSGGSILRARSVRPTPRPISNNIDDVLAYLNERRLENPVPLRNATPIRKPQQPAEKLKQKRRTEVQDQGPLDLRLFDLIRHASRRSRIRRGEVGDNNAELEVGETILIAGGTKGGRNAQWEEAARLAARPRATD